MFTRRVAVLVSRPLDEVFAFVEDARNRPRWDDSVDSEELTSPEPIGVGTTAQKNLDRGFPRLKQVLETGTAS